MLSGQKIPEGDCYKQQQTCNPLFSSLKAPFVKQSHTESYEHKVCMVQSTATQMQTIKVLGGFYPLTHIELSVFTRDQGRREITEFQSSSIQEFMVTERKTNGWDTRLLPQTSTQPQHGQESSPRGTRPAQGSPVRAAGHGGGGGRPSPASPSALTGPERRREPPEPPPPTRWAPRTLLRGKGGRGAERSGAAGTARGLRRGSGRTPVRGGASGRARAHPPCVCRWCSPRPPRRSRPSRSSALTWSRLHLARTRPCPSPEEKAPPPLPQPGRATAGRRLATAEAPAPLQPRQSERRGASERHEKWPMVREHLGKLTGEMGVRRLTDGTLSQWKGRDEVIVGGAEGAGACWAERGGASL